MEFPRQEYWSGLPFPSPGDLADPDAGIEPRSLALQADAFPSEPPGNPWWIPYLPTSLPSLQSKVCACMLSPQSCLTLLDPMDCSPPGCSVHGILQARILEWVAIHFSRGSSLLRDQTLVSCGSCIGRRVLYH